MGNDRKICVGMIAGAHGIKGLVRLRSFMDDPEAIAFYSPLTDESGKQSFVVTLKDVVKDCFTASVEGVTDRDAAEELRGTRLYAARAKMPKTKKREYYAGDLVGLVVRDGEGKEYGTVMDIHDHGAGTFLEIGRTRKDSFMLPFTDACVPEVDVDGGAILIALPKGWLNKEKPEAKDVKPPKKGATI